MNVRAIALPLIAAGIACGIWLMLPQKDEMQPSPIPAVTWRAGTATDFKQLRNYHELPAESPLRLSYACSEARHVYVFSHSAEDGTLLMFPSPEVKGSAQNPLAVGNTVLPGNLGEQAIAWTTRAEILATTTYVVVAAVQPVAELEALLPQLRRWTNSAMPNQSMQITNPTTGTEVVGKPRTDWPVALLQRAAERSITETMVNGPMHADALPGVWTSSVRVKEQRQADEMPGKSIKSPLPVVPIPGTATAEPPKKN